MRDIRTSVIGLLLGVCLVLAIGPIQDQAQAESRPVNAQRGRYLVTPAQQPNGTFTFFVHDLETDTIHFRVFGNTEMPSNGLTVDQILQKN